MTPFARRPSGGRSSGNQGPDQPTLVSLVVTPTTIPSTPKMTWFRLHAGTTVIDFPLRGTANSRTWIATMWPDARAPGGWARHAWQPGPGGRGFVPSVVELGDVVQFAVQHTPEGRDPSGTTYWHGYLHAVRPDSVLIHGPYPSPHEAHAAAQLALVEQINAPPSLPGTPQSSRSAVGIELTPTATRGVATTPAQPPATVSVAFHGQQATIGDPLHGWLVVDTSRLLAAMAYPPDQLADLLRPALPHLDGREPPLTLAALAAAHLPDQLPLATSRPPTPAAAPGVPAPDTPAPSGPPSPNGSAPDPPDLSEPPDPPDLATPSFPEASL
jgi:hypothetical protein